MSAEVEIPESEIDSSTGGPLAIEKVTVRPFTIQSVTMKNMDASFQYRGGTMENAAMRVQLTFILNYWYGIEICYGFGSTTIGGSGSASLGSIDTGWMGIGDVTIDGGALTMNIGQTTFGPFTMTPTPVTGIEAQCVDATTVCMQDTVIPTSIPTFGLNLPPLSMPNPSPPMNVCIASTTIDDMSTNGISVPGMGMTHVIANNVKVDQVQSGSFQASGSTSSSTGWLNLGVVGFQLSVDITTSMKADSLTMNDLSGSVTTDSVQTSDFVMNLDMQGVELFNLKIKDYTIPSVEFQV